jgi:isopentenyl phosphate kinase
MARPIVLLKLGGSLITDKTRPGVARRAVIRRLAREIAAAAAGRGAPRLLIGHGSGSFGHAAAAEGGLLHGADARRRLDAIARTQRRASDLHRIVVAALADAGALPFSLAPSSFLLATNGRFGDAFVAPVFEALDRGLLPVIYGDVILDRTLGAVIVSTEELFVLFAREAARRRVTIARAVWLGETEGILDAGGRPIDRLSAAGALRAARTVTGASGIDVTGGVALRLRTAGALARAGVSSSIADGRRPGTMAASIAGRARHATLVDSR